MEINAGKVFEVSWEVCNKVGGIYTVLSSKTKSMVSTYKDKYFLIGPYFKDKAFEELIECDTPSYFEELKLNLRSRGVNLYFGKWRVPGTPKVFLVEFSNLFQQKDSFKFEMWDKFGVDSLNAGYDFEEPLVFSMAVSMLLQELERLNVCDEKSVVHCHEWMCGFCLLDLKRSNSKIKSVFTTHATVLGRSLAGHNEDVYANIADIDPYEKAKQLGVLAKFTAEKAAAKHSHVFTTVSEVTGEECARFLGEEPEVLVLNGIDNSYFPNNHGKVRKSSRKRIINLANSLSYPKKYKNPMILYFGGRYEFRAKGLDVFLDALAELEKCVKSTKKEVIVLFFLAMENESNQNEQNQFLNYMKLVNRTQDFSGVYTKDESLEVIKSKLKTYSSALSVTHKFGDDKDPLIKGIFDKRLNESRNIKIIIYPEYLNGCDGYLDMTYYEAIAGCDLGVFPSYYEPWGYTPVESLAAGVPCITSNFSGFGQYIDKHKKGVKVVSGKTKEEFTKRLSKELVSFSKLSEKQKISERVNSRRNAKLVDWDKLIENYFKAHNLAVSK